MPAPVPELGEATTLSNTSSNTHLERSPPAIYSVPPWEGRCLCRPGGSSTDLCLLRANKCLHKFRYQHSGRHKHISRWHSPDYFARARSLSETLSFQSRFRKQREEQNKSVNGGNLTIIKSNFSFPFNKQHWGIERRVGEGEEAAWRSGLRICLCFLHAIYAASFETATHT